MANGTREPSDGRPHFEGILAEIMDEVYWFNEHDNDGLFDQYAGEHIAIYRSRVVDHDEKRTAPTFGDRGDQAHGPRGDGERQRRRRRAERQCTAERVRLRGHQRVDLGAGIVARRGRS